MVKQHNSLDIAKFVCALLIIIIHTDPFGSFSNVLSFGFRNVITVIAVPFFFCTSGFLLAEKLSSFSQVSARADYMKNYIKRLVTIYLFWSAVYFPFVVIKWVRKGFEFSMVLEYIKDFFFEGSYSTIWFLPALITATATTYLLHKKLRYRQIFFIGCTFYVCTLLLSSYYGLSVRIPVLKEIVAIYYSFFDSVKNGILFGLVFVSLGGMLYEEDFDKWSQKKLFLGSIASGILLCVEVVIYRIIGNVRGIDTVFSLIPMTFFVFLFVLNINVGSNEVCKKLRKYSMLLFLCQRLPISIVELFMAETVVATNTLVFFLVITVSSFAISFLLIKLSDKLKFFRKVY